VSDAGLRTTVLPLISAGMLVQAVALGILVAGGGSEPEGHVAIRRGRCHLLVIPAGGSQGDLRVVTKATDIVAAG